MSGGPDPGPCAHVSPLQSMEDDQPKTNKPILDRSSINKVIDVMLEELDEFPEPLQTVPEELQPMLERIQRMAEQNQALDPMDTLRGSDRYHDGFQYEQFPRPGEFGPPQVLAEGFEPRGSPRDPQYEQVCQTISELCQIMTPMSHQEGASSNASFQADMAMYQASTSQGYQGSPSHFQLPHLQPQSFPPQPQQPQPQQRQPHEPPAPTPTLRELLSPTKPKPSPMLVDITQPKGDNPRELRNQAEKQRRNKLKESISLLAAIVPPVVAIPRKTDKTNIMRLSAHFLRAHQYVFGDSINYEEKRFKSGSLSAVLSLLRGFLLTLTYKGIVVVVSHNVHEYLGYSELELIGTSVFGIVHAEDQEVLAERLRPPERLLGPHGELLVPDHPEADQDVARLLARERRSFVIRFRRQGHRSEPARYVTCHVEGFLRKSDKAGRRAGRGGPLVRRARARADNPRSSGNDVVFVGIVRPVAEGYRSEGIVESFRMEYRTRHSVDGEIIQCEQRIALVTGYTTQEVHGINAMSFMHSEDVHWVIIALREMYDQQRLYGESCYRLKMKNGEFVYMRTRGALDVDENSKIATTFVCTNTVVGEEEGKYFIEQMRNRFTISIDKKIDALTLDVPVRDDLEDLQLHAGPEDIAEVLAPDWVSKMEIHPPDYSSSDSEQPSSRKRRRMDPEIFGEPSTSYGQTSSYGKTSTYGQTSSYGQTSCSYGQTSSYGETSSYGQTSSYDQTSSYGETSSYAQTSSYDQTSSYPQLQYQPAQSPLTPPTLQPPEPLETTHNPLTNTQQSPLWTPKGKGRGKRSTR